MVLVAWTIAFGVVVLVLTTLVLLSHARNAPPNANLPPMMPASPWMPRIISDTYTFLLGRTIPRWRASVEQYGPVTRSHTLLGERVFMTGPESAQWVFERDGKTVSSCLPATLASLLGRHSVSVVDGSQHRRLRAVLSVAFTDQNVAHAMLPIESLAAKLLQDMSERSAQEGISASGPVKQYVLDALLTFILGPEALRDPRLKAMMNDITIWDAGNFTILPNLPGSKFSHAMRARKRIRDVLARFVDERREGQALHELHTGSQTEKPLDAMQCIIDTRDDDGCALNRDEILDSLLTLIFQGFSTTASVICSALCTLGRESAPPILSNLRAEALQEFPDHANAPLGYEALISLPYLEAFTCEVLRMFPPMSIVGRRLTERARLQCPVGSLQGGGTKSEHTASEVATGDAPARATYDLPKDTELFLDIMIGMNDGRCYKNPDSFDPDRFLRGREEHQKAPNTFLPFGGGARVCLGTLLAKLVLKLLFVHLARNFSVTTEAYVELKFPRHGLEPVIRLTRLEDVE